MTRPSNGSRRGGALKKALRLAQGPEEEVQAADLLCRFETEDQQLGAAEKALERTRKLVAGLKDKTLFVFSVTARSFTLHEVNIGRSDQNSTL